MIIIKRPTSHSSFKKTLAVILVYIASRLHPKNPEVMAFVDQLISEEIYESQIITKIEHNINNKQSKTTKLSN